MTTARLLREARRSRGYTQRALAAASGMTQPALADIERATHDTKVSSLDRILTPLGMNLIVVPTRRSPASSWADVIYTEWKQSPGCDDLVLRLLIGLSDDLAASDFATRVALCVTPPALCGDVRFDAAVAGIVEYHLVKDGLPVPAWVHESERFIHNFWELTPFVTDSEVPEAIKRHGVLMAESEFRSV